MQALDTQPHEADFALRHYLRVLWRRKFLIVAVGILGALVALLLSRNDDKPFISTTQILLQPRVSEQIFSPTGESTASARTDPLSTEIAVMQSRSVRDQVVAKVGTPLQVAIAAVPGTDVISITATAPRGERAVNVAQTYAETYITIRLDQLVSDLLRAIDTVQVEIAELDAQLAALDLPLLDLDQRLQTVTDENERRALENQREELLAQRQPLLTRKAAFEEEIDQLRLARNLTATGGAQIISEASPARRTQPGSTKRNVAGGFAVGLVLGVALAFVREHFDERLKDVEGLRAVAPGPPVLAMIPKVRRWSRRRGRKDLVFSSGRSSPVAESFRSLWTSIELSPGQPGGGAVRSLQVVSPGPSDGRSFTTANLAVAIWRTGRRVIVVDAHPQKPSIHRIFQMPNDVGLTSVLRGDVDLPTALQEVPGHPELLVLTSGPTHDDVGASLSPARVRQLVADLTVDAEVILIDGPPLLGAADSVMFASAVDTTVLLARLNHTRVPDIERAMDVLAQVQAPVVGSVLNGAHTRDRRSWRSSLPWNGPNPKAGTVDASVNGNGKGNGTGSVTVAGHDAADRPVGTGAASTGSPDLGTTAG